MTPLTYAHSVQNNEVVVGTVVDIAETTGEVGNAVFEDMDALIETLQSFRAQEVIITFISNESAAAEVKKRWNSAYSQKKPSTKAVQ